MQTIQPNGFLRGALLADAAASSAAAMLQLALAAPLGELLRLPPSLLLGTGAFLVAYVALLIVLARSARVWPALIWAVVLGNVAWALACVGLVLSAQVHPSALGVAFLGVHVVAVLLFAWLEYRGLAESMGGVRSAART